MIRIESVCDVGKSYSAKREKVDDIEIIRSHLKIANTFVDRDTADELLGLPIGWSEDSLFDELGAPRADLTLALNRREFRITGKISGPDGEPRLIRRLGEHGRHIQDGITDFWVRCERVREA